MERQLAAFKRAYGIGGTAAAAPSAAEPRPADMSVEYGQDEEEATLELPPLQLQTMQMRALQTSGETQPKS